MVLITLHPHSTFKFLVTSLFLSPEDDSWIVFMNFLPYQDYKSSLSAFTFFHSLSMRVEIKFTTNTTTDERYT